MKTNLYLAIPTVDAALDWVRRKYNVVIFGIEPFVDENKIVYGYRVKFCNKNGWNYREYLGRTSITADIYSAKRQALRIAISYINAKNRRKTSARKRAIRNSRN